ncbi:MgtC/SapB family protein [Acetobacter conturbans]|uniref:Protein MgtC n=1 Tax=Acetobacter conturbans TaxID=1737472 RepID=A0ABX0JW77_9PROT|nr:MgtC/SapB family protein [Acetobacter conturbans]NHN87094.1 MgtC/SapB family protein [Acetobacter conturbans]
MTAGLQQISDLFIAFSLSALIGIEREYRQKSAGLRTYSLVGLSAALFMLVSKHGFNDVIAADKVVLDPSRVAAQVVSGIGFIGAGLIFMRRNVVRGLTTAASVWLTAALGMAAGAGLTMLAIATTVAYFIIMFGFPFITRAIPQGGRSAVRMEISYRDGQGVLRLILVTCTRLRFIIDQVQINQNGHYDDHQEATEDAADQERTAWPEDRGNERHDRLVTLSMQVKGKRPVSHLIAALSTVPGVQNIGTIDDTAMD